MSGEGLKVNRQDDLLTFRGINTNFDPHTKSVN